MASVADAPAPATLAPGQEGPIVVHHLEASRSRKMLWLLEELGLGYDIKYYKRVGGLAPPELIAVHPLGKSPVITDAGLTLAESGAITEYLCDKYDSAGAMHPLSADRIGTIDHRYWLHYSEGSLAPFVLLDLIMGKIETSTPWLVRPVARGIAGAVRSNYVTPNLERHAAYLEAAISKNGGFLIGGRFTAADVQLSGAVGALLRMPMFAGKKPVLQAYLDKLHTRPAYLRAIERSRPYEGESVTNGAI